MIHSLAASTCLLLAGSANLPAVELARLKATLVVIKQRQAGFRDAVQFLRNDWRPNYERSERNLDPWLGEVATVVLKKGERATITQSIAWNSYPEDDLPVWFRANDESLIVPDKVTLNFERHQFRFQYEIKAGGKTGEFTVTVTPTPGKAVEVKVVVK